MEDVKFREEAAPLSRERIPHRRLCLYPKGKMFKRTLNRRYSRESLCPRSKGGRRCGRNTLVRAQRNPLFFLMLYVASWVILTYRGKFRRKKEYRDDRMKCGKETGKEVFTISKKAPPEGLSAPQKREAIGSR